MSFLINLFKKIFTPSAFKIGIVLTTLLTLITLKYYSTPDYEKKNKHITDILYTLHLKSIDKRLELRGEIPVSGQIVLLTVDEKSLLDLGRWPWPRQTIAKAVDKLREFDARLVTFDIIFSEQEVNPLVNTLTEISKIFPQSKPFIQDQITRNDGDLILSESIKSFRDRVVLGAYYEPATQEEGFQTDCFKLIALQASDYSEAEHFEDNIVPTSPTLLNGESLDYFISPAIENLMTEAISRIKDKVKKDNPTASLTTLNNKILEEQSLFCHNFLSSESSIEWMKKYWPKIQTEDESLKDVAFNSWLETHMSNSLSNPIERVYHLWTNLPIISKHAKYFGHFNASLDDDGVIRRSRLISRYGQMIIPNIALRSYAVINNTQPFVNSKVDFDNWTSISLEDIQMNHRETDEKVENLVIDEKGLLYINYHGKQKMFPHLGFSELLSSSDELTYSQRVDGEIRDFTVKKREFIKDKIFLVGATATAIYDLRVTPFDENFPGLEVHANVLENLLSKNFLLPSPYEKVGMLGFIITFGIFLSYVISKSGAVAGLFVTLMSLILIYFIDFTFLFKKGIVVTVIIPLFSIVIIYIVLTFYKYLTEERKKKELKNTFEKYVSPSIVNEILSNPDKLSLGGRKEHMTVMFSDVRGFTTFSEKLDPEVLSDFLNKYLTPMTRLIFKNNGTLDKYMGDAIMAFFGAPVPYKEHASKCCFTALEMLEKLQELNDEFKKHQLPPIDIGIGINTGDMSVGNMGSDIVRSYTVMGDSVNLASRLEGINKSYGTRIIVSEFTQKEVAEEYLFRELDLVKVKGKLLPVKIFELLGKNDASPQFKDLTKKFSSGFQHYLKKDFSSALAIFNDILNSHPTDSPSLLYVERCKEFLETPPPSNWDGVYEFKTK